MRRVGLGLMLGLGLAAGGTGVGWFAAMLEASGTNIGDAAEPVRAADRGVDPAAPTPAAVTEHLRAIANRTEALGAEVARLRWRISDLRRQCEPAPPASPPTLSVGPLAAADRRDMAAPPGPPAADAPAAVASGPPGSVIENPQDMEAPPPPGPPVQQAQAQTAPSVPPPPLLPERERAPVLLAAVEPAPVVTQPPAPEAPPVQVRPVQRSTLPAPVQRAAPMQPVPAEQVAALAPPPPPAPPEPEPLYRPGQELSVPEEAVRSGDLSFLDGCWLSEPFDNPVNGNSSTKIYCFDAAGNGQMSFRGVDGITCRAVVRARWEPGRRLVLDEPEDGTCGSIGPWHRETTGCAIGGDGLARCNSYEFYRQFNYDTRMTRI